MCGGGNDQTTTSQQSQQTYKPAGNRTFKGVISRANQVSNTPYTPITQGVAGLNPFQQQAMQNMSDAYNVSSPYMNSAYGHFENASQPLSGADVNQYMNPFAANVMANMNEVFGQQQKDTTGQLTQAAGGVGADRIAVGQSELARQQGLAAGQTMAGIYQNALQAAQAQQGIEQASGYGEGNLFSANMNSAVAGNNSLFGMGTTQQQTDQMAQNALYNQQMAQAAYPFQTAQWYAGLALPAAGAMGGTTTGTQTGTVNPPNPNPFSQIAGLGLTALGAFAKDGGGIEGYATGGSPYNASEGMYPAGGSAYIPTIAMPGMKAPEQPPLQFADLSKLGGVDGGVGGKGSNVQAGQGASNLYSKLFGPSGGAYDAMVGHGGFMDNAGNIYNNRGGGVEGHEPYQILTGIARGKAAGGEVEGYASGGSPFDWLSQLFGKDQSQLAPESTKMFSDRLTPDNVVPKTTLPPLPQGQGQNVAELMPKSQDRMEEEIPAPLFKSDGIAQDPWTTTTTPTPPDDVAKEGFYAGQHVPNPGPFTFPRDGDNSGKVIGIEGKAPPGPGQKDAFPNEDKVGVEAGPYPIGPAAPESSPYTPPSGPGMQPAGRWANAFANVPQYQQPTLFGKKLDNMNLAMMAAGLGMMGGSSPYFGVNVGQGGLKGIETLKGFQEMDAKRQAEALQNMLEAGRLDNSERAENLAEYDKPMDNARQYITAGLANGDPDMVRVGAAMLRKLGAVDEADAAEGSAGAAPKAQEAPQTEYGSVEPPTIPFTPQDKFVRQQNKTLSTKFITDAKTTYESAQTQEAMLAQMRHDMAQLPKDGVLVQGPGLIARTGIAKLANTFYQGLGLEPPVDTDKIASVEELNKLTTRMGFDLARTLGTREAMQIIQQATAAVPGSDNSPAGARKIMAGIQAMTKRANDYYEWLTKWSAKNHGDVTGADVAFNKIRPPSFYVERSQDIAAAQTLVSENKMSQEEASKKLTEMGIDPAEVF